MHLLLNSQFSGRISGFQCKIAMLFIIIIMFYHLIVSTNKLDDVSETSQTRFPTLDIPAESEGLSAASYPRISRQIRRCANIIHLTNLSRDKPTYEHWAAYCHVLTELYRCKGIIFQ